MFICLSPNGVDDVISQEEFLLMIMMYTTNLSIMLVHNVKYRRATARPVNMSGRA